jgi:hypothetical protein
MNRFLKYWRLQGKGEQFRAEIVAYADDIVILSRGHAVEARGWMQTVMDRIGLTLNEQTSRRPAFATAARRNSTFSATLSEHYTGGKPEGGTWPPAPQRRACNGLRTSVHELLRLQETGPWE